jgi:DNA polymerase (family 10)
MYTNKEIARVFKLTAQLMELYDQNPFKIKSYLAAAFKIERVEQLISSFSPEELGALEGIGKSHVSNILEILKTGTLQDLELLRKKTPNGILQMLNIKGIGPKKAKIIWQELKIESIGELLYACNENRLIAIKGFGDKIQQQILQAIQFTISNSGKFHYSTAEKYATALMEYIVKNAGPEHVSLTGQTRRKVEIIDKVEFLVGTHDVDAIHKLFKITGPVDPDQEEPNEQIFSVEKASPEKISGKLAIGLPFEITICLPDLFFWKLFITTGSTTHVAAFDKRNLLNVSSEHEIYEANNKPYVIPEMREDGIVHIVKEDDCIKMSDLKGILHVHSLYSDGIQSLEQMAQHCKASGFEYLGISDHSQSAFYANGLKPERLLEQHQEIEKLNAAMAPFKILKGIESDILSDGSLDYEDAVLSTFDFVIASIHSNLKMDKAKATNRLLKAIENPYTTILGHPTGRLLLMREGYEIDHKAVIDACALHGVSIELNANPYRLDLDWRWINYAVEKGLLIAINPDAHSKEGYEDMHFGIAVARKAGLTKTHTLNALTLNDITAYLGNKKKMKKEAL